MIINLISSPRNISTALMYSFAQRADITVLDEPFYGTYLRKTDADHPGKSEIIAGMPSTDDQTLEKIQKQAQKTEHVFVKNMAHHLIKMDLSFLDGYTNLFLIRNPKQLIASFAQVIPNPKMSDIGIQRQAELYSYLEKSSGKPPLVLDSNEILKNPASVLSQACKAIDIPFMENMLHWPAGEIHDDVPWIKHWYANVLKTEGFGKQSTSERPLPEQCKALYDASLHYFETLAKQAIKA